MLLISLYCFIAAVVFAGVGIGIGYSWGDQTDVFHYNFADKIAIVFLIISPFFILASILVLLIKLSTVILGAA